MWQIGIEVEEWNHQKKKEKEKKENALQLC